MWLPRSFFINEKILTLYTTGSRLHSTAPNPVSTILTFFKYRTVGNSFLRPMKEPNFT